MISQSIRSEMRTRRVFDASEMITLAARTTRCPLRKDVGEASSVGLRMLSQAMLEKAKAGELSAAEADTLENYRHVGMRAFPATYAKAPTLPVLIQRVAS